MPFQAAFAIDELKRCILTEPELASDPMVQAVLAGGLVERANGISAVCGRYVIVRAVALAIPDAMRGMIRAS